MQEKNLNMPLIKTEAIKQVKKPPSHKIINQAQGLILIVLIRCVIFGFAAKNIISISCIGKNKR
jgi:hypothetical protein